MKDIGLLIWLTQFGISVVCPLAGFTLLSVWLRGSLGWGDWVVWAGVALGAICAVDGFRESLRLMSRMGRNKKEKKQPPVSFNDHE